MADYTRIIEEIIPSGHRSGTLGDDPLYDGVLVVDPISKQITPLNNFSTLIGATNDINTNVIIFSLPLGADYHALACCSHHIVKWHNLTSGEKGKGILVADERLEDNQDGITDLWSWVVPPEAMTAEGTLKIAISIYDEDDKGNITYQWNSLPYSGLTIAKGMDEVSINDIPADSTITIDLETRQISIPAGMQTELGKAGEVGLAKLRFRCDRFYRDIDFSQGTFQIVYEDAYGTPCHNTVTMLPTINDPENKENTIESQSDLLEFEWNAQEAVSRVGEGVLNFIIAYTYMPEQGQSILWKSNVCSYFTIGESFTISGETDPSTGASELIISNGTNLDTMLDELLGEGLAPSKNVMTANEAIVYAIQRLLNSEIIFDAND